MTNERPTIHLNPAGLAAARIGFGLLLIRDLLDRARFLDIHYGPDSIAPYELLAGLSVPGGGLSLHLLLDHSFWIPALMLLQGLFALLMIVGYKTRTAVIGSIILLLSLHHANPLLLNSGDLYLRSLLIWMIFLPVGSRLSIDACIRKNSTTIPITGWPARAWLIQVSILYLCTALFKHSAEWWIEGSAVEYALSLKQMRRPLALLILEYPVFLRLLSYGTLLLELLLPALLLFSPGRTRWIQLVLIATIGFHLGIESTLMVGLFSWVSIAALLPLFPTISRPLGQIRIDSSTNAYHPVRDRIVQTLLAIVIIWNGTGYVDHDHQWIPDPLRSTVELIGLNQRWSMFAPNVLKDDGWITLEARMLGNETLQLFNPESSLHRDSNGSWLPHYYHSARWRKWAENLALRQHPSVMNTALNAFACASNLPLDRTIDLSIVFQRDWSNLGYKDLVEPALFHRRYPNQIHCF